MLLFRHFAKSDEVKVLDNSVTNTLSQKDSTIVINKIDTITQYKVVYKDRIVKEYIYVKDTSSNYGLQLPLIQKYYHQPNRYDIWISGVEPLSLDRINVYNNIEYRTITNTITKSVYLKSTQLYFGGGFYAISNTIAPIVGIAIKTKKETLFSLDFGRYNDSNLYLVTMKFKILGK